MSSIGRCWSGAVLGGGQEGDLGHARGGRAREAHRQACGTPELVVAGNSMPSASSRARIFCQFGCPPGDVSASGYVMEEFLLEGSARSYRSQLGTLLRRSERCIRVAEARPTNCSQIHNDAAGAGSRAPPATSSRGSKRYTNPPAWNYDGRGPAVTSDNGALRPHSGRERIASDLVTACTRVLTRREAG
jgi:hypothetical protein